MEEKEFGFLKNLLNNIPLIKWVKKFSADGLQKDDLSESLFVEKDENTICVADSGLVKMFFSSARFSGKTYVSLDIKHIKEVLSLIDGDGRLIINDDEEKRMCYIQSENNVVVIAPTTEEQEAKAKKKAKKKVEDKSNVGEEKQK